MADPHETIRFDGVCKTYVTRARGEVHAVRDFDLSCREGDLTCVLGPSGCGKTTLLRLAAGLETPTRGTVSVARQVVSGPRRDVALVSQEGDLLPWRRVGANVALGLEIRGLGRRRRKERSLAVLRRLGLPPGVAASLPHELSGGMRQRVALARALCTNPRMLFMDEPFSKLDEPTRFRLQAELLDLWLADRQTVLFVTHSIEEAVFLADWIVLMTFGRTVERVQVELPRPRDRLAENFVQLLLRVRRTLAAHEVPLNT